MTSKEHFAALSESERQEMEAVWNANPVLAKMGLQVDLSDPDCIRAHLQPGPQHRGGLGTDAVNGAVLSGICDLMVGLAGICHSQKHRTGTVQLNIHFLRPLRGDQLLAEARVTKVGRALVFSRVEIMDAEGEVCASCEGIASVDRSKAPVENYMAI